MVDPERITVRLARLEQILRQLEVVPARGVEAFLGDDDLQAQTERRLQLAIQICIDVGAQLVGELGARAPADYRGIFVALADAGAIDGALADRLAKAAGLRNLLVHMYLEIDSRLVFGSLGELDDLREFAARARALADG